VWCPARQARVAKRVERERFHDPLLGLVILSFGILGLVRPALARAEVLSLQTAGLDLAASRGRREYPFCLRGAPYASPEWP